MLKPNKLMRWSVVCVAALLSGELLMAADTAHPQVRLETSAGEIVLELDAVKAPTTTENFLRYVDEQFYDGVLFHRVIPNFVIQGGGFNRDFQEKQTRETIQNEADNGLKNVRGSIAMARTPDPHSASAQFFINLKDNAFLDHRDKSPQGWGYAVFGKVIEGMAVVDAISDVPTNNQGGHSDVPVSPVVILKAQRIE